MPPLTRATRSSRVRRALIHGQPVHDPGKDQVVWVYAITDEIDPGQLAGLSGVGGESVRAVTESGLTAVVGSVDAAAFGDDARATLLADLTSIERVGRLHHQVIACVAAESPVLPLRLATVYSDDQTVKSLLAERSAEFAVILESFRGTEEWGLKVYVEPPARPDGQRPDSQDLDNTYRDSMYRDSKHPAGERGGSRPGPEKTGPETAGTAREPGPARDSGPARGPGRVPGPARGSGPARDPGSAEVAGSAEPDGGGHGGGGPAQPLTAAAASGAASAAGAAGPSGAAASGAERTAPGDAVPAPVNGTAPGAAAGRVPVTDFASAANGAETCTEVIDRALSGISVASRRHPSPDPRFATNDRQMLLHASYLLSSDRAGEFASVVRALSRVHEGLRADLTGPWPPYSFADLPDA